MSYIQNVPVEYMDVQSLWNDRRDPHANPMSKSPRREEPRGKSNGMAKAVEDLFHPGAEDTKASYKLADKRLYEGQK
jgi:hypothetical protein